jgi:hypothetical protein
MAFCFPYNSSDNWTDFSIGFSFRSTMEVTADGQRTIVSGLERILVSSRRLLRNTRFNLDQLSREASASLATNRGSTTGQIRKNLIQTHTRHLQQVIVDCIWPALIANGGCEWFPDSQWNI